MTVTTCLQQDVPKGSKLTFETSGKLKGSSVVAAQRGTTVSVEKLFHNLPVRRRELERNIKREWHKVISLLNQYACILTDTKFTVSQQPTKGKRIVLFSTKGNPTTRDNIINIFGAKTMSALVPLDLRLEMQPSNLNTSLHPTVDPDSISKEVRIVGHVSRPTHGDGRQTPDRQMFFINGRPCGLPQFAKTFNEVYKSYNSTQSPFIFADIRLDTHMYDVNVSPDKRTILLHDQNQLLDTIRTSLVELFDSHDYAVPASQLKRLTSGPSDRDSPPSTSATKSLRPRATESPSNLSSRRPSTDNVSEQGGTSSEATVRRRERLSDVTPRTSLGPGQTDNLLDRWVENRDAYGEAAEIGDSEDASATRSDEDGPRDSSHPGAPEDEPRRSESRDSHSILARVPGEKPPVATPSSQGSGEVDIPIPSVQPMRGVKRAGDPLAQGSPVKRTPEPAKVTIGTPRPFSGSTGYLPGRPVRMDEDDEDDGENQNDIESIDEDEEGEDEEDVSNTSDEEQPSFGAALSQRFAAGGRSRSPPSLTRASRAMSMPTHKDTLREREKHYGILPRSDESESEQKSESANSQESDREFSPEPNDEVSEQDDADGSAAGNSQPATPPIDEAVVAKPRVQNLEGSSRGKYATLHLVQDLSIDEDAVKSKMSSWLENAPAPSDAGSSHLQAEDITAADAESKLSLIISKSDFSRMRVAGQFNLGFIIAVRPGEGNTDKDSSHAPENDELFIIDQHASDEKYNFERLQATTVVQSQRLVHPKRLELTALEEEIVMQSTAAIEANGFKIEVNTDGEWPVGSRCLLMALPLSRETTFSIADLEELISLLGDESSESKHIPRPSKVRKMFAMRACRSSIMIGKALTQSQMYSLVGHMGELDKPWNCPHGRPTMRHLCRMQTWDEKGWAEDLESGSAALWMDFAKEQT
jgi:DNA mismatch repair protein PMS2